MRSPTAGHPVRTRRVEGLFDGRATAFELVGPGSTASLTEAERAVVARATQRRLAEFAAGRQCAHAALERFGAAPAPLLPGPDRAPRWPDGTVGSISHTGDYAVAVVASARGPAPGVGRGAGIGVDAERIGRLTPDLSAVVFSAEERAWLDRLPAHRRAALATVCFAAKEAFYKAQHPWTGGWVGFADVAARRCDHGLELVPGVPSPAFAGWRWPVAVHWIAQGDLVIVGVTLWPRPAEPPRSGIGS